MCLGPADVAEISMNVLAAARARMNEHARYSIQDAKLLFREERLDQIDASGRSLTKVAVAMDHVDWLTFDRKGKIPAKATSLLHLHTRLSSTPIVVDIHCSNGSQPCLDSVRPQTSRFCARGE